MTPAEVLNDIQGMVGPLAKQTTMYERDANAYDASGGNFDDAYTLGCEDGGTELARDVLSLCRKANAKDSPEIGIRYCLVQDESCHWYIIPASKRSEWSEWTCSDEAMDGIVPDYATSVGGCQNAITFLDPQSDFKKGL